MSLFHSCDLAFEQFINPKKCFFFPGSIPPHKMVEIKDQLGFKFGCLPFIYLGIPIFLGKPKNIHLKPIFDKVKWKLLSWKWSLLSLMGRFQLINEMLLYFSMLINGLANWSKSWSISFETLFGRGTPIKGKSTLLVGKVFALQSMRGRGLGIRSLATINVVVTFKLSHEFAYSDHQWANFLRAKFLKNNSPFSFYRKSSIWLAIKDKPSSITHNTSWIIRSRSTKKFWNHSWWYEKPIAEILGLPLSTSQHLPASVKGFGLLSSWKILDILLTKIPSFMEVVNNITVANSYVNDKVVWRPTTNDILSFKDVINFIRCFSPMHLWSKMIWSKVIPPNKSFLVGRFFHNRIPSNDNLKKKRLHDLFCLFSLWTTWGNYTSHLF